VASKTWLGFAPAVTGPVLYIVGEGARGSSRRVEAWLAQAGYADADIETITFHNGAINLTNWNEITAVAAMVEELQPVVIVIDTLARCAPGAEESTAAMSEFVAVCDYLRRLCGSTILVIHHSGKRHRQRATRAHCAPRSSRHGHPLLEGRERAHASM
jgi:RecA-family ATPase